MTEKKYWMPEDLPICIEVLTGHTLRNREIDSDIQHGDLIQIISPKSEYHKWIGVFDSMFGSNVVIKYKKEDGIISTLFIDPPSYYLTWQDFKFKKLNSLEDAEK